MISTTLRHWTAGFDLHRVHGNICRGPLKAARSRQLAAEAGFVEHSKDRVHCSHWVPYIPALSTIFEASVSVVTIRQWSNGRKFLPLHLPTQSWTVLQYPITNQTKTDQKHKLLIHRHEKNVLKQQKPSSGKSFSGLCLVFSLTHVLPVLLLLLLHDLMLQRVIFTSLFWD